MKVPTVLITGASGKLGKEVAKLFITPLTPSHSVLPIDDPIKVDEYIQREKPDIVIHLAAAVSPPKCEKNRDNTWRTNVDGTRNLIEACKDYVPNCYFIYMSTPCEFGGGNEYPKGEYDMYFPDNYYGFTKLISSMLVLESKLKSLVIRGNFVPKVKWPYPKAFVDRKSNYLFAHQLAKGIKEVIDTEIEGVIHITGNKILTMHELALKCPDSKNVQHYTLAEYYKENPGACKLTKNMILANNRWKSYNIDED